jgi:site-specific recombinase XerD
LVNKGKSLEIIGEILGHSDIRTTKKYAHVHLDAMRKAMEE